MAKITSTNKSSVSSTGGNARPSPYNAASEMTEAAKAPPAENGKVTLRNAATQAQCASTALKPHAQKLHDAAAPRGINVSGRVWKRPEQARSSAKVKVKSLRSTWEQKRIAKQVEAEVKARARRLSDAVQAQRTDRARKIKQKRAAKEAAQKAAVIGQTITDTAKIRRMSKKQRAKLTKADTSNMV
jgi:rRNA-processing protein CGR1